LKEKLWKSIFFYFYVLSISSHYII